MNILFTVLGMAITAGLLYFVAQVLYFIYQITLGGKE